jgi:hypothetical protein
MCLRQSERVCPNRNGARHCCQAPLRRAKDLPVFVTLISRTRRSQKPVLDPGAPAQASLSITAVRRPGSLFGSAPERASPPNSPPHGPKASATLMFRGPSWAGSLLRGLSPWGGNRPRKSEHQLFRRLLPTGPELRSLRHRPERQFSFEPHSIACRRRSVLPSPSASFWPLPAFRGGGDFRPDHELNLHKDSESRQAESLASSLWITGISRISRDSRVGISPIVASRAAK